MRSSIKELACSRLALCSSDRVSLWPGFNLLKLGSLSELGARGVEGWLTNWQREVIVVKRWLGFEATRMIWAKSGGSSRVLRSEF